MLPSAAHRIRPAPAEDDLVDTLQRSDAKHLAHTTDPHIDLVDEWSRLNTLPHLEARRDHCRHLEQLATEHVGIHPATLAAAHQRAERTARFGRPGDAVIALDRHNIGTLIEHDDAHGRASVAFVSATGRTAERTLPWSELELHSDEATPRDLPPPARWWLDQHAYAVSATTAEWNAFLNRQGVNPDEADLADRAARRKIERATNELIADQPPWLINLLGYQPADPIGLQTWTSAVRDIARWQLHTGPAAATVPAELGQHLLTTRAWLDQRAPQTPTWPYRRSHRELVARRAELDAILDTAPSDQHRLIEHLRSGEPRLLNDTAEALTEVIEHQRDRRSWILEHWPHIVEYAGHPSRRPLVHGVRPHLDPDSLRQRTNICRGEVVLAPLCDGAVLGDVARTVAIVGGLIVFGAVFAMNSALHSFLVLAYASDDEVALDVGFYYSANAAGRLVGTLLSGVLFLVGDLSAALWGSTVFVVVTRLLTLRLPPIPASSTVNLAEVSGGD